MNINNIKNLACPSCDKKELKDIGYKSYYCENCLRFKRLARVMTYNRTIDLRLLIQQHVEN